jgi:hypothetical protein
MEKLDKFGWMMDLEGNKIELWEPVDEKYKKASNGDFSGS